MDSGGGVMKKLVSRVVIQSNTEGGRRVEGELDEEAFIFVGLCPEYVSEGVAAGRGDSGSVFVWEISDDVLLNSPVFLSEDWSNISKVVEPVKIRVAHKVLERMRAYL